MTEAEIRADEREKCHMDVCDSCMRNMPVERAQTYRQAKWRHLDSGGLVFGICRAWRIRERAHREAEAGK